MRPAHMSAIFLLRMLLWTILEVKGFLHKIFINKYKSTNTQGNKRERITRSQALPMPVRGAKHALKFV